MILIHPHRPIKGESYTLRVPVTPEASSNNLIYISAANIAAPTVKLISKDGGSFVGTTNNVTSPTDGIMSLVLTATEMDANEVNIIVRRDSGTAYLAAITIYTDGYTGFASGGGATAQEIWEYVTRTLTSEGGASAEDIAEAVWSSEDRTITSSDCLSYGTIAELKQFIKTTSSNLTEKQLYALLIRLLKT